MCDKLISQNKKDGVLCEDAIHELKNARKPGMASRKNWEAIPFILIFAILLLTACKKETVIPEPTVSISANPMQIDYNGTSVINWSSTNADYCNLNGSKVNNSGSLTVNLTTTTKYSITAYGQEGKTASNKITIIVIPPDAPTIILTNIPTEPLRYYDSTSFSWEVTGEITSVTLNDSTVVNSGTFQTPRLTNDTSYTLKAIGPGGMTTQIITIPVGPWTSSDQGLMTGPTVEYFPRGGWGMELMEDNSILSGNEWKVLFTLTDSIKDERYFYGLDGKHYHYNVNEEFIGDPVPYQLVNENGKLIIKMGSSSLTVLELSEHKHVVLYETTIEIGGVDYPSLTRTTYVR